VRPFPAERPLLEPAAPETLEENRPKDPVSRPAATARMTRFGDGGRWDVDEEALLSVVPWENQPADSPA